MSAEETKTDARSEGIARRRLSAGQAIQRHFSSHPEAVIIASVSDGKVNADVTEFSQIGEMIFAKRLLDKFVDEAFENALVAQRAPAPATGGQA